MHEGHTRHHDRGRGMQGAAVAEILLAVGPADPHDASPPECTKPSVALYLGRLAIVHREQGREALSDELDEAPYRILGLGYLRFDAALERRIESLISVYLRLEDLAAVEYLTGQLDDRSRERTTERHRR